MVKNDAFPNLSAQTIQVHKWIIYNFVFKSQIEHLRDKSQYSALTVLAGNGVGYVDLSIIRPGPHAAVLCAGVSVSLGLRIKGDVILNDGLTRRTDCRKQGDQCKNTFLLIGYQSTSKM